MVVDEVAGVVVFDKGGVDEIEVVVFDSPRGGGKGEHVIHSCGNFERAFVAMAFHPIDPFGVHNARTDDAGNFFVQCADNGAFGAGMIVVVDRAIAALEG